MTDEEMAENWYYKNFPVTLNFGEEARKREVIDIFLAGLKAGKDMAEADLATVAYMQGAGAKGKHIAELEDKIAELGKDKEELCHAITEGAKACLYLKELLTKANEMLNEFMRISEACDEDFEHEFSELIGETEQFSREIEKWLLVY